MLKHALLLAGLPLFMLGCTTPGIVSGGDYSSDDAALFADFLAGTYASRVDDFDARTDYYARAFERAPTDIFIGRRALTFAVLEGDMELARELASDMLRTDGEEPMARLILGQAAFRADRHRDAGAYFAPDTQDFTMGIAMDIEAAWNAEAAGDRAGARAQLETIAGGDPFRTLGRLGLAVLDARDGKVDEALAHLDAVDETGLYPTESALTRARILSGAGRLEEARDFLVDFNGDNGDFDTGPVQNAIDRLAAGRALDSDLSPRAQAARLLTEPSYSFFVRNRALDAAELYLRLALDLDPDHSKAKVWLGNILEGSDRNADALALYRSISDDDDFLVSARLAEANVLFDEDRDAEALDVLEAVNDLKPSVVTREALGRARLIRENYEEALPIYDALVESLTEEELKANPQPLYFRGISHERTDNFDAAVADFRRVLSYTPDDADTLNYLGYSWADRGENLQEAFEMIERAVELEPDSGAITDSLGWAHYKLGRYQEARKHLERAAELSPGSATIIDHLGDVYWRLGRYREAGYQWRRALTLGPTDEEREAIDRKLEGGLDAANASP